MSMTQFEIDSIMSVLQDTHKRAFDALLETARKTHPKRGYYALQLDSGHQYLEEEGLLWAARALIDADTALSAASKLCTSSDTYPDPSEMTT